MKTHTYQITVQNTETKVTFDTWRVVLHEDKVASYIASLENTYNALKGPLKVMAEVIG